MATLDTADQKHILESIKKGDEKAFEILFKTLYAPLCQFSCSFLKDMDESESLVQEVFVSFWDRRNSLSINSSPKSYLFQMVRNHSLNVLKHREHVLEYERSESIESDTNNRDYNGTEQREFEALVSIAIAEMPEQRRRVFKMSRFEGLKYQEIAEKLELSVKTVENHMGAALKHLRKELAPYFPLIAMTFINILTLALGVFSNSVV